MKETRRPGFGPAEIFGRELLTVDGALIMAVKRNFTREADDKLADYMKRLVDGDAEQKHVGGNSDDSGPGDGKLAEKIAAIRWRNWIAPARTSSR